MAGEPCHGPLEVFYEGRLDLRWLPDRHPYKLLGRDPPRANTSAATPAILTRRVWAPTGHAENSLAKTPSNTTDASPPHGPPTVRRSGAEGCGISQRGQSIGHAYSHTHEGGVGNPGSGGKLAGAGDVFPNGAYPGRRYSNPTDASPPHGAPTVRRSGAEGCGISQRGQSIRHAYSHTHEEGVGNPGSGGKLAGAGDVFPNGASTGRRYSCLGDRREICFRGRGARTARSHAVYAVIGHYSATERSPGKGRSMPFPRISTAVRLCKSNSSAALLPKKEYEQISKSGFGGGRSVRLGFGPPP